MSLFEGYKTLRKNAHFGGSLIGKNNAKEKRPFSAKYPMHVVLRSGLAVGSKSLLRFAAKIQFELASQAKRHAIEVKSYANAGNHLHLVVRAKRREDFRAFIRGFASTVARVVTGANRNGARLHELTSRASSDSRRKARFWDFIPWSTIVSNFVALKRAREYLALNRFEVCNGVSRGEAKRFFEIQKEISGRKRKTAPPLVAFGFV